MKTLRDLKVGDEVIRVSGTGSGPLYHNRAKVERIMKRFIVLDDGSKWLFSGVVYSSSDWYTGPTLAALTEDIEKLWIQQRKVRRAIKHLEALLSRKKDGELMLAVYEATKHLSVEDAK